jgi:tellurite methyltransferase
MDLHGWDERYRTTGGDVGPPAPLVVRTAAALPPGRALDLACGTGRHAVWLAGRGWQVTAVDGSDVAIASLRARCPAVDARVADLAVHGFDPGLDAWDLVLVCYYLQRDLFEPVKRAVVPGGLALVIVHLVEPGHETSRYSMRPGELRAQFDGWVVHHLREGPPDDDEHRRAVAEIVAERPREGG